MTASLWNLASPVRDGTVLRCNVYLPREGLSGGPYPAIVERSCYAKQLYEDEYRAFTDHGFAVVLQDVRGRGDSEGEFRPLIQEPEDGYDTVEWVAAQPWCDGHVGLTGYSYAGWTAWAAATRRPPHLRALWVNTPAGLFQRQEPFDNGIPLLLVLGWLNLTSGRGLQGSRCVDWHELYRSLPLLSMDTALGRPMDLWREWLAHPGLDDYWTAYRQERFTDIDVPTVVASGWWDSNLKAAVAFHEGRAGAGRSDQHLIVGPWDHGQVGKMDRLGEVEFGPAAQVDLFAERVQWFRRWLMDEAPSSDPPPVRVFMTGANRWLELDTWPPPADERRWYLHSQGDAATKEALLAAVPPREQPADVYVYDPDDPVIALGGDWDFYPYTVREGMAPSLAGAAFTGASDLGARHDVLTYLSDPADDPVELVGEPAVDLYASSNARDTDWFVTLDAIDGQGRVLPLSTGQLRARFHAGLDSENLLEPGRVYLFRIPMRPLAHRLDPGCRLRLWVTSSRFPVYARNPNTGAPIDSPDGSTAVATNSVLHDAAHPSALVVGVRACRH